MTSASRGAAAAAARGRLRSLMTSTRQDCRNLSLYAAAPGERPLYTAGGAGGVQRARRGRGAGRPGGNSTRCAAVTPAPGFAEGQHHARQECPGGSSGLPGRARATRVMVPSLAATGSRGEGKNYGEGSAAQPGNCALQRCGKVSRGEAWGTGGAAHRLCSPKGVSRNFGARTTRATSPAARRKQQRKRRRLWRTCNAAQPCCHAAT